MLEAASARRLDSGLLHSANAGSFLVGTLQGHAALPTRVALLRRLGGDDAPEISQIALADAPILLLEVCTSAVLAAIAATAVPAIPAWAPVVLMGGALAALGAMRLAHLRFRHHSLCRGLAVLADPGARTRLVGLVLALTGAAVLRTWIILLGFGLPAGPADAALMLFSMGAIGLLPLSAVGTAPTAAVVAVGSTDLTSAAAAGVAIAASTVLAALLYAGACWACRLRFTSTRPCEAAPPTPPGELVRLPVAAPPNAATAPELDVAA